MNRTKEYRTKEYYVDPNGKYVEWVPTYYVNPPSSKPKSFADELNKLERERERLNAITRGLVHPNSHVARQLAQEGLAQEGEGEGSPVSLLGRKSNKCCNIMGGSGIGRSGIGRSRSKSKSKSKSSGKSKRTRRRK